MQLLRLICSFHKYFLLSPWSLKRNLPDRSRQTGFMQNLPTKIRLYPIITYKEESVKLFFQNRAADSTKFPRKICGKSFLEYTSLFSTASNPAANLAESLFAGRKAIGYWYSFSVCFSTMQLGKVCGSCLVQRLPQLLKLSLFVPKDLFLPIFSVQNTFHK